MTDQQHPLRRSINRRDLFKVAGAGAMGTALAGVHGNPLNPKDAQPVVLAQDEEAEFEWDDEYDVVVVGSGGAACSAGVTAVEQGASVIMLEKSDQFGGTTVHSGGGSWVPNNYKMRDQGIEDSLEDTLRYCCRVCFPTYYDETAENYGLPQLHYDRLEAYVNEAADIFNWLEEIGALQTAMDPQYPLYYGGIPEAQDVPLAGQLLFPLDADGNPSNGGEMIRQFRVALEVRDVEIRMEHRVTRVIQNENGRVLGVEATNADGDAVRIGANSGVIFATGGFANNQEMNFAYLRGPVFGGGAPASNQGDFVHIGSSIGTRFSNMQHAWLAESALDDAAGADGRIPTISLVPGDSMIYVNRFGHRVVDEKMQYQDRTHAHFNWDPIRAEYTNLFLVQLYDEHTATRFAGRYPIPTDSNDEARVVTGETFEELAENINAKLTEFEEYVGNKQLDENFLDNLRGTVAAFNQFAETGEDRQYLRGETPIEVHNHAMLAGEIDHDYPNTTMYPISEDGPYYAILIVASSFDTKGGPMTDEDARVLHYDDEPIPGLFGAGNCIAAPVGQSYPGPGATLGPALTFGYFAGLTASAGVEEADDDEESDDDDDASDDEPSDEDDETDDGDEENGEGDEGEGDDESDEPQNHVVEATDDLTFEPEHITISAGDSITWVNVGQLVHTATGDPDRAFDPENGQLPDGAEPWHSGDLENGDEFTHTFTVPGEYTYACMPHEVAGQVGSITVE